MTLDDLFVVGLAFDISGAALLAKGLLVTPALISKLSASYYDWNARDAVERVRNRVDAEFGVGSLLFGFALQVLGYALLLAGASPSHGTAQTLVAVVLAGAVGVLFYFGSAPLRRRRVRAMLVPVARAWEGSGNEGDEKREGWTFKKATRLVSFGVAADYPTLPNDDVDRTPTKYVHRVFGVVIKDDDIA